MKKIIVLCIMVLFMTSAVLTAQITEWQWAVKAGGSATDRGNAISRDADGNSYTTGYFGGTVVFGATTLTSSGSEDVYVAKLDADGNWQWVKNAGGIGGSTYAYGIGTDADGNSYVTGGFDGTAFFGADSIISDGSDDVFVAKIDADGNWLWASQSCGTGGDYPYGISVDANGNSYITGKLAETATFGTSTITSGGVQDIFVAKIDTDGNWQWAKRAGGTARAYGYSTSVDTDGNVYATGYFSETGDFGATTLTSSGHFDIYVAKLDTDGNWQWAKRAGGSSMDVGRSIGVDTNGNVYVTGTYYGPSTFGTFTLTSNGVSDIFVAKLDTDGNWQWAKNAGGSSSENCNTISVDANGNAYVGGGFKGETMTFGTFTITNCGTGGDDLFVAKIDTDGNWHWAISAGGPGNTNVNYDMAIGISADANGNAYVTGGFKGDTITFGNITLTGTGTWDIIIAKLTGSIGDFNSDGYVDATDLQMFGDNWHFVDTDPCWDALYDLVSDGIVNAADLQIFGDHWHDGTPPTLEKGYTGKGPNAGAGIEFDLDATTTGNQHLTAISSQPAGTYIRLDVYATDVQNLDTYGFDIIYDASELQYIASSATNPLTFEGNILTSNGGTAVGWMVDTSTPGVLGIAYTLTGTDTLQAPEGDGLVGDIVFKALVDTYGELSFDNVYYYDTFGVVDNIINTGTATLPVELSAFTATYNTTTGYTAINWTTASETDIIGFNIYRSTEDEYETSKKINADIIVGHGTTTEISKYEFVDIDQLNHGTTYYYWLESIEFDGINLVYSSINLTPEQGSGGFVDDFQENLLSNYPNPCAGSTVIEYSVKGMLRSEIVEIEIYNILGQHINTIEGRYGTATWNTAGQANGIYFYKLNTDKFCEIKKMIVTQ